MLCLFSVIDCKVEYAEYGREKELKCGCIDDEIQTRLWYMDGALLIVDEHPEDNWAPDLLYENETLRLQIYGRKKYYIGNVTYECIAILRNGSKLFCGSYTIKAYGKWHISYMYTVVFFRPEDTMYRVMH